ncbi:MAG: ATP-binding protein [Thermoanaerobaculia bacterium]
MQDFEKLGLFYLGKPVDAATGATIDEALLYDSRDLVTHAVCLGMTGSGKTGLGIALLEEAAIDGVPALVIDPKGDLTNLLLTFPDLAPADFAPWVQEEEARRKGLDVPAYAAAEAAKWKKGLASWGEDGDRIRRLKAAASFRIFTPGSNAGEPISILATFAAPPPELVDDAELFGDRVQSTATSLLGLVGIAGDPLRSREHILISSLFDRAWRAGASYDLAQLIADIQKPPLDRVGVLPLESFYPAKERFELAMTVNALLAAPGFEVWLKGTPLDVQQLLYTSDGRPQVAVLSIAHLSDAERMFFVSLLLNQTLAWMRTRQGTSSLRAILYMDEIFGYLPPTANPPSKRPMLTLLKQARAFGLGVVLATQNPVDLDYKALSNIGTWLLGRLQTERDLARVLDGLEGVAGGIDRQEISRLLAGLGQRRFLLHNVHEEKPVLFESRWAMSYLAGPLTRDQIRKLKGDGGSAAGAAVATRPATPASAAPTLSAAGAENRAAPPILPAEIPVLFRHSPGRVQGYSGAILGQGRVHFQSPDAGWSFTREVARALPIAAGEALLVDWAESAPIEPGELSEAVPSGASGFAALPAEATRAKSYESWAKSYKDFLARAEELTVYSSKELGESSKPGESEGAFRVRLADLARQRRDAEVDKVKQRFAARFTALGERMRRAQAKVAEQESQATAQKISTAASVLGALAGAFFGRRKLSGATLSRAATSARSASRSMKESRDVGLAEEGVEAVQARIADLNAELGAAIAEVEQRADPQAIALTARALKPKKADVELLRVGLVWLPLTGA